MQTTIDEIAPDIFRLSTFVPEVAPPAGFTFNQFLVRDEEPFLFHTGMRQLFPLVSEAVGRLIPVDDLRWISFAHVEADECGAMNQFLAVAPRGRGGPRRAGVHGVAERPGGPAAAAMADDEVLDIGTHRMRFLADAARPPQLGERAVVRRDDGDAVRRRPVHPRRRRAGDRRPTTSSRPAMRRRGDLPRHVARARPGADARTASPTSARRRWPSCTARRTAATAPPSCGASPPESPPPRPEDDCGPTAHGPRGRVPGCCPGPRPAWRGDAEDRKPA